MSGSPKARRTSALALCLAATLAGRALADGPLVPSPDGDPSTWQRVEYADGRVVKAIWEKYHFTPEAVQGGERTVPRIYFASIPARWGQTVAPELPVVDKKRTFLYGLVPAVLAVNEEVTLERRRLRSLTAARKSGKAWTADQSRWLGALAERYQVDGKPGDAATLDELANRVDVIPASLVLAQAAMESGWATSRFAAEGSALFGQWTYGGDGIKPKEQRTETKGNYRVQSFDSPRDSIRAYLLNLNTHAAYKELRAERRRLRKAGKGMTGTALAAGLLHYSERGQAYVDELRSVIRVNRLHLADAATLRKMRPILLVPVGKGVE
jgi:Bax protein